MLIDVGGVIKVVLSIAGLVAIVWIGKTGFDQNSKSHKGGKGGGTESK